MKVVFQCLYICYTMGEVPGKTASCMSYSIVKTLQGGINVWISQKHNLDFTTERRLKKLFFF